jgi:hypothetical protein
VMSVTVRARKNEITRVDIITQEQLRPPGREGRERMYRIGH